MDLIEKNNGIYVNYLLWITPIFAIKALRSLFEKP